MSKSRYLAFIAGLTAVSAASGCSNGYHLTVGLDREDHALIQAYHQQIAQWELARAEDMAAALNASAAAELVQTPELNTPVDFSSSVDFSEELATTDDAVLPQDMMDLAQSAPSGETVFVSRPSPVDAMGGFSEQFTVADTHSPLDTTGQVARVSFSEEGADFDVTTDPTGEWMMFSSTRHRETSDLYRQRVGGEAVTQLTNDPGNDMMPAFSPDGEMVAFASDRSGNWDLYLMAADGGPAVQLTRGAGHDIHPSFSPDGKRLAYCTFGERTGQWQLVVIDVENPAAKHFIGNGLFPQWSPSEDTLLFQRARQRGTRWFSVWTVELNSKNEAGSPTEIAWSPEHACITPGWSPDGSAVVFCTVADPEADSLSSEPASSDVWLVRADGSGRTRLTTGQFANFQPAWSADNTVYFVSNRGREGVENIWAIGSGDAMQVVLRQAGEQGPATADVPTDSD